MEGVREGGGGPFPPPFPFRERAVEGGGTGREMGCCHFYHNKRGVGGRYSEPKTNPKGVTIAAIKLRLKGGGGANVSARS